MTKSPRTPANGAAVKAEGPLASVVIVNYNGAHLLPACLDGLAKQTLPAEKFDVVVVDNASADPSRDLLTEQYPDVKLLVSYQNRGFAGGNNFALTRIKTPYAVLLNNDAIPEPDWLENLLAPLLTDDTGKLVATASKILFMPKFVTVSLSTTAYQPGGLDPRTLGARIYGIKVDGQDVTGKVLFEKGTYGPEGNPMDQFRWSFADGEILVPLPSGADPAATHRISIETLTRKDSPITFACGSASTTVQSAQKGAKATKPAIAVLEIGGDAARFDVVNNVGGIVFVSGAGADRGFEEIDSGQYDQAEEVFTACGNGVALRMDKAAEINFFDERYFMYYEDTDLSWRLRSRGGRIDYVPTAVLRHIHSASSVAWSPRWLFHVERNRLLTLTKDASANRATKQVVLFVLTTGKMGLRLVVSALRTRRRPAVGPVRIRLKVLRSYVRLLPGTLAARRQVGRQAVVSRDELEKWLVTSR